MENIKRPYNKQVSAYILLESLIALALLAAVTTFMLSALTDSQKATAKTFHDIETLNTAKMAMDAKTANLKANGVEVSLAENADGLIISDNKKEVLHVQILQMEK